jgi:hypothetical protein
MSKTQQEYDVSLLKTRLYGFREKERDIENQIERLDRLVTKMSTVGVSSLTDMPKSAGNVSDKIGIMVSLKQELEDNIIKEVEEQREERRKIESILDELHHSDEKAVIRMRYFDRASWNEIIYMMFGDRTDFNEKEDSYLRRVHKIHGAALQHMAKILAEKEGFSVAI